MEGGHETQELDKFHIPKEMVSSKIHRAPPHPKFTEATNKCYLLNNNQIICHEEILELPERWCREFQGCTFFELSPMLGWAIL